MTSPNANSYITDDNNLFVPFLIMAIAMLMVSPFLSILVQGCLTILLMGRKTLNKQFKACFFLCMSCAFFVSLVNTLRVPESDLMRYIEGYQYASNCSVIEFMKIGSSPLEYATDTQKEPLYGILVWILNRVFEGNVKLFVFTISFIQYMFFCYSLILLGRYVAGIHWWTVATSIVLMCFIPYIFTLSVHLIRQCLANSILFIVITRRCFMGKRDYALWLVAPFIHSSAWFFIPLLFLDRLKISITHNKLFFTGFVLFFAIIRYLSGGVTGEINGMAGYVAERMLNDTEEGENPMILVLLNLIIFFSLSFIAYFSKFSTLQGVKHFCHIWMALLIFLLINYDNPFFVMRFSFYLYPMVAVIALFLLSSFKFHKFWGVFLAILSMIAFLLYLDNGPWTFYLTDSPLSMSFFDYFS